MGRKGKGFQWTEDEDDPERIEPVVRPNRSQLKAERWKLEQLVHELVGLPAGARRELPLDEEQLAALDELASLPGTPARKRQQLRVMGLLADVDMELLKQAAAGDTEARANQRAAERWRDRLIAQGDEALRALLEAYPEADRQRLRQLARAAAGGEEPTAARKLYRALREIVTEEAAAEE